MFTISVKADVRGTVDYLNRVKKGLGDRAITSSLNKTAAQARTAMIRRITQEYVLPASTVRERLQVARASRSGEAKFTATLIGNPRGRSKRAMNIIHFVEKSVSIAESKRRRKRGQLGAVYVKIKRAGGRKAIEGAFIANNGRTVFKRTGAGRLPIEPVSTIGIPQMFNAKKINIPIQRLIASVFPVIFKRDVKYFLSTVK